MIIAVFFLNLELFLRCVKNIKVLLEQIHSLYGEKVLAHVAGPSGSGKTELVNTLTPIVRNISLRDLDEFDDFAAERMGMLDISKNEYSDRELYLHHTLKQNLIDQFIRSSNKPVIFFGHIEESGREIKLNTSTRILLTTSPRHAAIRRARNRNLSRKALQELIRIGYSDVKYYKSRGYVPMSSRQVYALILTWSKDMEE